MVNAQEWLDHKYPLEERKTVSKLDTKNTKLEGKIVVKDWPKLKVIFCNNNNLSEIEIIDLPKLTHFSVECCQLTNIKVKNCPAIEDFDIKENLLTDLDFLKELNPEKLFWLNIQGNNFAEQDLSFASNFINLERLMIKNRYDDKFEEKIYNRFHGSLEPLKDLKKLKWLNISNTDIDSGLEYLPESMRKINCWNDWKQAGCSRLRRELERAAQVEGVTEKLQGEEEGDPDPIRRSDKYYRLAPWHQAQALLLEKKPLVQKLREQLKNEQTKHSKLREQLENHEKTILELEKRLGLVIKEEEAKKMREKEDRIKELEELVKSLTHNTPSITIAPNFANVASFNNQIHSLQYNEELLKKELNEVKEKYQKLEATNESVSDPQKLKKTILFLGAKQNFATTRQDTINSLIETYENVDKSSKKYDKIILVSDYISNVEEIASIVPGGNIVVKVISKGSPIIANLLKSHSLTVYSQVFGNYLIEDEKALLLLEQTYQSLVDLKDNDGGKISPILTSLLKFKQQVEFSEYSVFEVSKLQKGIELTSEEMNRAIELLTNHFKEFVKELRQETMQYVEEMEKFFATEDSVFLQTELIELLEKLSDEGNRIKSKETYLQGLITDAKDKLKSQDHWVSASKREEKTKERELLLEIFLDKPEKLTTSQKEMLEKKIGKERLKNLCQTQTELVQLQKELKGLQKKKEEQSQIQIPPK